MMLAKLGIRAVSPGCLFCQRRAFSASHTLLSAEKTPTKEPLPTNPPISADTNTPTPVSTTTPTTTDTAPRDDHDSPLANAPRSHGKRLDDFTPTVLSRPIGFAAPPKPGENTGVDGRTFKQRREDFINPEKHRARRRDITHKLAKPYFRDWTNMKWHNGKSFLAPPRPFKRSLSLYFPNLFGRTLLKDDRKPRDTTPLLEGRLSVVAVSGNMWAENQTKSFVAPEENPALQGALDGSGGAAQLVHINIEENWLRAWLIRLFAGSIRRQVGRSSWDKYFLVQRGISDEIRETIGLLNSKVGYVYLVDRDCRIRWAGSGQSEPEEREGLVKSVRRLLDEMKKTPGSTTNSPRRNGQTGS